MWTNLQFSVDLYSFSKEILNGKLHFLCSEKFIKSVLLDTSKNLFEYDVDEIHEMWMDEIRQICFRNVLKLASFCTIILSFYLEDHWNYLFTTLNDVS